MVRGIPRMKLFVAAASFRIMTVQCQQHVQQCVQCKASNSHREMSMPATQASIAGSPWSEVVIDTL